MTTQISVSEKRKSKVLWKVPKRVPYRGSKKCQEKKKKENHLLQEQPQTSGNNFISRQPLS